MIAASLQPTAITDQLSGADYDSTCIQLFSGTADEHGMFKSAMSAVEEPIQPIVGAHIAGRSTDRYSTSTGLRETVEESDNHFRNFLFGMSRGISTTTASMTQVNKTPAACRILE